MWHEFGVSAGNEISPESAKVRRLPEFLIGGYQGNVFSESRRGNDPIGGVFVDRAGKLIFV